MSMNTGCRACDVKDERIAQLEQRIAELEDENAGLAAAADNLLACAYHCADEHYRADLQGKAEK